MSRARADEELPVRRFERLAATQPGAVALEFEGQTCSYGELDERANLLALLLLARGVTRETLVAVCVPPSLDIVVAMLAIWKAGGAYVPLDPSHPAARIAEVVEEARPLLLLTHQALAQIAPGLPCLLLDAPTASPEAAAPGAPDVELLPQQTAYVLHTSGSTGRPKGVAASHANLAFYTSVARERYGFSRGDVFCSIARYTFSISLFELVSPLLCGGKLLLLPRARVLDLALLTGVLRRVTVVHAGPSLLGRLFRFLDGAPGGPPSFPGVRHASSGGDLVFPDIMERMKDAFPAAELFVIYGCTEISCMGCTFPVPRGEVPRKTLVGVPFAGVTVRLLDGAGQGVAAGEVGQVHVAGPGVTRGYLSDGEAGRFPWIDGERHYATGDLARLDASGDLEILGREDDQVKLHGIRVEPGEIEHFLRRAPGVREAVVAACEREDREKELVAFVVGDRLEGAARGLRDFLLERLPDHMVPTEFIVLDALPLNLNLKVDRRALPGLARARRAARAGDDGQGTEARVAGVFARFLGLDQVGLDDDFFDLGGHSLLALRVTDELRRLFGLSLPLHILFQCPSARSVARLIRAEATPAPRPVPLNSNREGPAVFMLAAVHAYRSLARELERDFAVHGLSIDRDPGAAPIRLEELASEYAALLREAQPAGPFRLAGYSFGGVLAFEVARQLRRQGREVARLWLIDAVLPMQRGNWLRVLGRFAGLTLAQQRQSLARELRLLVRPEPPGPQPPPGDRVRAEDELRTRRYLDAVKAYLGRMGPYGGPVTLVVAGRRLAENLLRDPLCGWGLHVAAPTLVRVEAHHHEILSAPFVAGVAAAFRAT